MTNTNESPLTFGNILKGLFGIFAIVAVLIFAATKQNTGSGDADPAKGSLEMWGTIPQPQIQRYISEVQLTYQGLQILYRDIDEEDFTSRLTEALAAGKGPDLVMIPDTLFIKNRDRLFPIPSANLTQTVFKQEFIDHADMLIGSEGIYGFPAFLDPLVMYYNRDIYADAFLLDPPRTWDELMQHAEDIAVVDNFGDIQRAGVNIGTFNNNNHADDILAMMIIQAGNPITREASNGLILSVLEGDESTPNVAPKVLDFYASFADPIRNNYSWNTGLPEARTAFLQGDLGIYFGYASEYDTIVERNPNLNFEIASVPQLTDSLGARGFGKMTFIGITKLSDNIAGGFLVARKMTSSEFATSLASTAGVSTARRDLLRNRPPDLRPAIIRDSAVISRSWHVPDLIQSRQFFANALAAVRSGAVSSDSAIKQVSAELNSLLFPR